MKKLILFILSLSFSFTVFAQWEMNINFENGLDSIIKIDTVIMPNNQWQIGTPSKTYFDSAYSPTHALITDTINPYFGPSVSRAEIKWVGYNGFNYGQAEMYFNHKFNTDSLLDGCSIEFSTDGGLSFTNVLNNSIGNVQHYNPSTGLLIYDDSLPNNKFGLSGNSNGWIQTSVQFYSQCSPTMWNTDTLIIHFVFRANSVNASNKEGWMIDDIYFYNNLCESVQENTLTYFFSTLYPNPALNSATIDFENPTNANFSLQVYDITGRTVIEQNIKTNRTQLNTQNLPPGIYQYRLISEKERRQSFGKFVVE